MVIENTRLLTCDSLHWVNINSDIENAVKICPLCVDFQMMQYDLHEIPGRQWGTVGTDIFTLNDKHYMCIVEPRGKFPVIKQIAGISADDLIKTCRIIFSKYGLPSKLMSHSGTNYFREITGIFYLPEHKHNVISSYDQQSFLIFCKVGVLDRLITHLVSGFEDSILFVQLFWLMWPL